MTTSLPLIERPVARPWLWLVLLSLPGRLFWVWRGLLSAGNFFDLPFVLPSAQKGDQPEYVRLAANIIRGTFSFDGVHPTSYRPPLYPLIIAALHWQDHVPLLSLFMLQVVLSILTVLLVHEIARPISPRVAWLAGLAFALHPMSWWFVGFFLTETVFVFLVTLAIYAWGRGWYARAGMCFGLSMLTRPTAFPFIVVLPLVVLFFDRVTSKKLWTIPSVAVLVVLPWVARNNVVLAQPSFLGAAGGAMILAQGAMRAHTLSDGAFQEVLAHHEMQIDKDFYDTSKEDDYRRIALTKIRSDPVEWLVTRAIQYPALVIYQGPEYQRGPSWLRLAIRSLFFVASIVWIALALWGVWIGRHWLTNRPHLWLFPAYLAMVHLPLWVETRYFLPAFPLVAVWVAVAVDHCLGTRTRRARPLGEA